MHMDTSWTNLPPLSTRKYESRDDFLDRVLDKQHPQTVALLENLSDDWRFGYRLSLYRAPKDQTLPDYVSHLFSFVIFMVHDLFAIKECSNW